MAMALNRRTARWSVQYKITNAIRLYFLPRKPMRPSHTRLRPPSFQWLGLDRTRADPFNSPPFIQLLASNQQNPIYLVLSFPSLIFIRTLARRTWNRQKTKTEKTRFPNSLVKVLTSRAFYIRGFAFIYYFIYLLFVCFFVLAFFFFFFFTRRIEILTIPDWPRLVWLTGRRVTSASASSLYRASFPRLFSAHHRFLTES